MITNVIVVIAIIGIAIAAILLSKKGKKGVRDDNGPPSGNDQQL